MSRGGFRSLQMCVLPGLPLLPSSTMTLHYLTICRVIRPDPDQPSTSLIIHNQPHIAIGVVINGTHWVADVGYGGRGLRLPIRNDLVHASDSNHPVSGEYLGFWHFKQLKHHVIS